MIDINFEGSVDTKGYRLEHGRIIGNGGPKRRYRLKDFPPLYPIFAKTPQTPEGLKGFVTKFGRLTSDEFKDGERIIGDNVRKVLPNIETISTALETLRGRMGNPPTWLGGPVEYEASTAIGTIRVSGGIPLPGKLTASLVPDPITGIWHLQLQPPTLLDAIWLQFGQAITSNAKLRFCLQCSKPLEPGKRADAKFCSDGCRVNYDRRSAAQ